MILPGTSSSCKEGSIPRLGETKVVPREREADRKQETDVNEDALRAYLDNFGKPPREVAAAMLSPTDENITAMQKALNRQQALAAYVGQRMTSLAKANPIAQDNIATANDLLPFTIKMRSILYVTANCHSCHNAVDVVKQLSARHPALEVQVSVLARKDQSIQPIQLAEISNGLPVVRVDQATQPHIKRVPALILEDETFHKRLMIKNGVLSLARIEQEISSFRKGNLGEVRGEKK